MRPERLHRSEFWAVDNTTEQRLNVADMIMFRWIFGLNRKDIIRHKLINCSYSNRVASIVDEIRENRFRWFGHVMRRNNSAGNESGYGN